MAKKKKKEIKKKPKKKIKKVSKKQLKKVKGGANITEEFSKRLGVDTGGIAVTINDGEVEGFKGHSFAIGYSIKF